MYTIKTYYTLEEVYKVLAGENWDQERFITSCNWKAVLSLYTQCGLIVGSDLKPHINDVLTLFYHRFMGHYVGYVEDYICYQERPLTQAEALKLFSNIVSQLVTTYPKWSAIADIYANNLSKLMDGVKVRTEGVSRFNDTPQEEGSYLAEEYSTNVQQTEGETISDDATKMRRIKEIEDSLNSVLQKWSDELGKVLIDEDNI